MKIKKILSGVVLSGGILFAGLYTAYLIADPKEIITVEKVEKTVNEDKPKIINTTIAKDENNDDVKNEEKQIKDKETKDKYYKSKEININTKENKIEKTNNLKKAIENSKEDKPIKITKKEISLEERNRINKEFNNEHGIKTLYEYDTDKDSETYGKVVHVKDNNLNYQYGIDEETGLNTISYIDNN